MATPSSGPGDFVLEVAKLGQNLTTAILKLTIALKVPDHNVERLLDASSVTTSILFDLGTTINKHKEDVYIGDDITRPRAEVCKADFEKLLTLSKEASEKGSWTREEIIDQNTVAAEIDPWNFFRDEIENCNKFFMRIEATPGYYMSLNDTVKYKIYKELENHNRLDVEQALDLKRITSVLPKLVKAIERDTERKRKLRISEDTKKHLDGLDAELDMNKDGLRKPIIQRNDSFSTSDVTMFEPNGNHRGDDQLDVRIRDGRKHNVNSVEEDRRSIVSIDSFHESNFLDTKEVFEEWTIRWYKPVNQLTNAIGLFGIRLKLYTVYQAVWAKTPELRSQDELRVAYSRMVSGVPEAKYRTSVMKEIKKLPRDAREALEELVESRETATNNITFKRQWSVVAVQAKPKHRYGGGGFFSSKKSQEWLIMLKGETVDRMDRKYTRLGFDPWRKSESYVVGRGRLPVDRDYRETRQNRYRSQSPYYDLDRRERSYSPSVRERRPMPPPARARKDHGQRGYPYIKTNTPGFKVVEELSKLEAAEEKMQEILADLPTCFAP